MPSLSRRRSYVGDLVRHLVCTMYSIIFAPDNADNEGTIEPEPALGWLPMSLGLTYSSFIEVYHISCKIRNEFTACVCMDYCIVIRGVVVHTMR